MKKFFSVVLTCLWLTAVGMGMGALLVYDYTPGQDVSVPSRWPAQSSIHQVTGLPTLVMFAHPDCPCTRASIGELAILMTHCQKKVNAYVLFIQPKGSTEKWVHTDLWQSAQAIPGVTVRADMDDQESKNFKVTTSGHVVLYAANNNLLFDGGITPSRGHYGDNDGVTSLSNLLNDKTVSVTRTPVFGCSLVDLKPSGAKGSAACTR
jgi:hypothetical protein